MSQGIEIEYDGYGKYVIVKDMEFLMEKANIEYILQNKKDFLGCFPMDRLPPFPSVFPKSMIINTQKSSQPGEHWVALVLTEKKCYYFDSFGWPIMEENIFRYLEPHYEKIIYSDTRVQDITSIYCGAFCVCFVLWVNDEVAFNNFSNCFKEDDLLINDKKLRQYFKCMIFRI